MKTVKQLLNKYQEEHSEIDNLMNFNYNDLLQFVPYKKVYPYLEEKVTPAEWGDYYLKLSSDNVKKVMRKYMTHAWSKLCDERGISSLRNLAHYKAWLWILEENTLTQFLEDPRNYACYGAPILVRICKRFGWNYMNYVKPYHKKKAAEFVQGEGC